MAQATVTSLTAKPGIQQIKLTAVVDDPSAGGLPYLAYKDVEFTWSPVNDRDDSDAEVIGTEHLTMTHTGRPEEVTGYYWARPRFATINATTGAEEIYYGAYEPSSPTGGVAARAYGQSGLAFGLSNAQIVVDDHSSDVAVDSGALRIAIKTKAGNDPSEDDPVFLAAPSSSAGAGTYEIVIIDSALQVSVGPGSTLGVTVATDAQSLWVVAVNDADDPGTWRLGVFNNSGAVGVASASWIDESRTVETSAADDFGGPAEADDINTIFTDVAITTFSPMRILGRLIWNAGVLATPGTWVRPTTTVLLPRDAKRPGEIARQVINFITAAETFTDTIPYDGTTPQANEGSGPLDNGAIFHSPVSQSNWLMLEADVTVSTDVDDHVILTIYRGGGARSAVDVVGWGVAFCKAGKQIQVRAVGVQRAGADNLSYVISLGVATGGTTVTTNGVGGSGKLNGLSSIKLTEIVG